MYITTLRIQFFLGNSIIGSFREDSIIHGDKPSLHFHPVYVVNVNMVPFRSALLDYSALIAATTNTRKLLIKYEAYILLI